MKKYNANIFEVVKVTEIDVYDEVGAWDLSNFKVIPKVGEIWCVITVYQMFHMAFRVE